MPYDPITAQRMIRTCATYERLPGSEFIMEVGKMLAEADKEISGSESKVNEAKREARRYQKDADDASAAYQSLKDSTGRPFSIAMTALEEIAGGAKGAKKIAAEAIKQIKPEPAMGIGANFRQPTEPITGDRIGAIETK
jgi:hypothetical protein